jgi:hypothetical protein
LRRRRARRLQCALMPADALARFAADYSVAPLLAPPNNSLAACAAALSGRGADAPGHVTLGEFHELLWRVAVAAFHVGAVPL